jgi:XRE family transcriptional regulator, aerobic/anaerobic benzoate catabolism transcriptional regulator
MNYISVECPALIVMQRNEITRAIGQRVRATRAEAGLSRKRLAAVAGVSERYLNELENGEANVTIGILVRIAKALTVEFSSLMPATPNGRPMHDSLAALLGGMSVVEQEGAIATVERYLLERRRQLKGIALLGLRGAGKTTIGGLFAEKHGLPFVSVTQEIETRAGMSLADLFNLGSADAYRSLENEVVRELARQDDRIVLETAGGIVANPEALSIILGSFKTVWLKAEPEEHLARVTRQGDLRPMRGNPKALEHLKALLRDREAEYSRAEILLNTTGKSPEDCVAELEQMVAPMLVGGARPSAPF